MSIFMKDTLVVLVRQPSGGERTVKDELPRTIGTNWEEYFFSEKYKLKLYERLGFEPRNTIGKTYFKEQLDSDLNKSKLW